MVTLYFIILIVFTHTAITIPVIDLGSLISKRDNDLSAKNEGKIQNDSTEKTTSIPYVQQSNTANIHQSLIQSYNIQKGELNYPAAYSGCPFCNHQFYRGNARFYPIRLPFWKNHMLPMHVY
ncbi:hypothetical protein GJ496_002483 [Pomphorhynchus laevis]|nr:hypothetical protein GJ496_002483 [Pomphorhynchus laevis]